MILKVIYETFRRGETLVWSFAALHWMRIRFPWIYVGKGLKSKGGLPFIHVSTKGSLQLGANTTFVNSTRYNGLGLAKRCSIVVGPNAEVVIEDNTGFSGVSICCTKRIHIGHHVMIGGNSFIWDTNFHALSFEDRMIELEGGVRDKIAASPITIREGAFIGANSIVLKGVTIGARSVIGAGSVVVSDVPAEEVWGGNPARFIRRLTL